MRVPAKKKLSAGALFLAIFCGSLSSALAKDLLYTPGEADCAAKLIFMNECSSKDENLLYWSKDEAFPSIGIGHFIWYPKFADGSFHESFPEFLDFAKEAGLAIPVWIARLPEPRAPWRSREEFYQDFSSVRMGQLYRFLQTTKREQAQYILRRFQRVFPTILEDIDESKRAEVRAKYDLLMKSPAGAFAMIDYVNFKGEGFRHDARYEGMGWGLAQVLMDMKWPDDPRLALEEFILAAERVLENRVSRSPRRETELRWLPGWKSRVNGYRHIDCA